MTSSLFNLLFNPTYILKRELSSAIQEHSKSIHGKILDVGCANKPYKKIFTNASEYVGMEYDTEENRKMNGPDVFYNGDRFPFPDNSFDSIVSTEVLEHVFNPNEFLKEIHRTLKPGGFLLLTTPLMWKEHQQPHDYGRYSSFGLKHIVEENGFTIERQDKIVTGILAVITISNRYIKECIGVKNYYVRLLLFAIFIAPWTILGILLSKILPKENSTYIGNIILARK